MVVVEILIATGLFPGTLMPWCEECSKYWTPTAMAADGTCPGCGKDVEVDRRRAEEAVAEDKAPWHFKLLVVALVVYLGWRFIELFV